MSWWEFRGFWGILQRSQLMCRNQQCCLHFWLLLEDPFKQLSGIVKNVDRHGKPALFLIMPDSCLRIIQAKTKAVRRRKSVNNATISYNLCIHQSRKQTHNGIVEQNVETHVGKGEHFQFQMARHPAHVGKLASSTRSTSGCPKRNGRVGTVRYGYALRTFSDRPSDSSCRSFG